MNDINRSQLVRCRECIKKKEKRADEKFHELDG